MRRPLRPLLLVALAGCATTTVDSAATTAPAGPPVTEATLPADAPPRDLLTAIVADLRHLDEEVVEGVADDATLARIDAAWRLVEPHLRRERPELLLGFGEVVDLARTSVERRRPADASKASRLAVDLLTQFDATA